MTEPRGLNLGKRPDAATTMTAPAPVQPPIADMKVAGPVAGQQVAIWSQQEIDALGKTQASRVASVADKITQIARAGDMDEVGKSLNALLLAAKKYDPSSFAKGGGFLGLFKTSIQQIKNHFSTVDGQVDQLLHETDGRIALYRQRGTDLEALYKENEQNYHDLSNVIADVERRVAWAEANPPAIDPNDSFSAQRLSDWNATIAYARKRADDLRRVQTLSQQQGPQIRLMQQNAGSLVLKLGEIRTTTIPVLKNAFALYIINIEMEKGAQFTKSVDDLTNETLIANSKKLGQTTVAVQTSLARSSIDLATLQQTQADTIKAIEDVERIRGEMKTRLDQERPQIEALSQQLAQTLGR